MTSENAMTVRELRLLAKERGLKGYSKLRKAELIELILQSKSRFHDSTRVEYAHILDGPVVDNTPILQPTAATKPKLKQRLNALGNKIKSELNTFVDSIEEYIPPAVKEKVSNIIKKVNDIFNTVYKKCKFQKPEVYTQI